MVLPVRVSVKSALFPSLTLKAAGVIATVGKTVSQVDGAVVSQLPLGMLLPSAAPALVKPTSTPVTPFPLMLSPLLIALPPPAATICGPQVDPHQFPWAVISPVLRLVMAVSPLLVKQELVIVAFGAIK